MARGHATVGFSGISDAMHAFRRAEQVVHAGSDGNVVRIGAFERPPAHASASGASTVVAFPTNRRA